MRVRSSLFHRKNPLESVFEIETDLKNFKTPPDKIPAAVMKLGKLYKAILNDDVVMLEKTIAANPETKMDSHQKILSIINKLLNFKKIDQDDRDYLDTNSLKTVGHIKAFLHYRAQKDAYVSNVTVFLMIFDTYIKNHLGNYTPPELKQILKLTRPMRKGEKAPYTYASATKMKKSELLKIYAGVSNILINAKDSQQDKITDDCMKKGAEMMRNISYLPMSAVNVRLNPYSLVKLSASSHAPK